jgi:hypothetical protein
MKPDSAPEKGDQVLVAFCKHCNWPRVLLPDDTLTRCRNPHCGMEIDRLEFRPWRPTKKQRDASRPD